MLRDAEIDQESHDESGYEEPCIQTSSILHFQPALIDMNHAQIIKQIIKVWTSTLKRMMKSYTSDYTEVVIVSKMVKIILGFTLIIVSHYIGNALENGIASRFTPKTDSSAEERKNIDLLVRVASQSVYWIVITVTFLIILNFLGVQTASIIALLSTIGLAVGLAVQGVLTNIVTGILITVFKAFRIGDVIEVNNKIVRVKHFNLVTTEVEEVLTGVSFIVPNGVMRSTIWINHTKRPERNLIFSILVSNKITDLEAIIKIIECAIRSDPHVLKKESYIIGVGAMDSFGTRIDVIAPIHSKDYPDVILPIQTTVRSALAKNNVQMLDGARLSL